MLTSLLVGIDIGASKVATVVAEVSDSPRADGELVIEVIGAGLVPVRGMHRGSIAEISRVAESISVSRQIAERMAGVEVLGGIIGVTGDVVSQNQMGVGAVANPDMIDVPDVERALASSKSLSLPDGREVIFAFPRSFSIDGQRGISDPVGMSGVRLEVETHVVTAATSLKQNIDRCVRAAGVLPKLFILEPVAAAAAVCSEAEQRNGVILVDAGAGHTDVEVFVSGAPYLTAAVPIGGGHVTRDIAIGLNTSEQQAETLKTRYGTTLVESVAEDEVIEFLAADGVSHESAPRRLLAEIIAARVEELFEHLIRVLSRARCLDKVPSGVVLTGGASLLPGFPEMAQRSFGVVPVRVGRPRPVKGHTELIADPAYAVALGLILNGARLVHGDAVRTQPTPESGVGHWLRRILHRG